MSLLKGMLRQLRVFADRRRVDTELDKELALHIQMEVEKNLRQGMPPEQARRAALLEFGGIEQTKEGVRDARWTRWVEEIIGDFRLSLRALARSPAFTTVAVLTLALGIGATTAIFSVVDGVVIKPLPYPKSEAVVTVTHSVVFGNERGCCFPFSPQMLATYAANGQAFEELGIWTGGQATITGLGNPEQASMLRVTQGTLRALAVQPVLGRWFSSDDDQPGAKETVILSEGYWQRRLGGDPDVLGRVLTIDSRPREVIGVMPAHFAIGWAAGDLVLPLQIDLAQPQPDYSYSALARLKSGISVEQANADIARMLPIWKDTYVPAGAAAQVDALQLRPAVHQLKEDVVGDVGQVLWVLLGSISILLLIACANVANLLLVRAESRGQELAVRTALGAGWRHIARTLVVESLTLSLLGGLVGLGLAYGGLQLLVAFGPSDLPRLGEITIDSSVLIFAAATSIASGMIFGLAPLAKILGRKGARRLPAFVSGGARWASAGRSQHRSQNALVVVQVALALVLLIGSGLMIRTFQNLRQVDPGFTNPDTVQTVRVSMPDVMRAEPERVARLQAAMLERLQAIPGVTSAAYVDYLPTELAITAIVTPEDATYDVGELPPVRRINQMSPGLFATLGTPLLAGRDVSWEEIYNERNVALVSEAFARVTWDTVDGALGKRIKMGTTGTWQEVVGVVADIHNDGPDRQPPPTVYWPARAHPFIGNDLFPTAVTFLIRSDRTGTEGFLPDIRETVADVTPDLPIAQVRTLRDVYDASMARTSFSLVLLAIAGAMALALSIVGIYGVLAYAVMQHRREVGIRLALGARPGTVTGMFVSRGIRLSSIGIALGVGAAVGLTRLMASLLFGVTPLDAGAFAAAAGVLVISAAVASYVPARRAAAVDPVETLAAQ